MSHHQLSRWYSQLSALTRSGIPIPEAVREAGGLNPARREDIASRLLAGEDPRDVWLSLTDLVGKSDALVLAAGQMSGRFPELCNELSRERDERARLRTKLLMGAGYPLLLLNFALFVSPFVGKVDFSGKNSPDSIGALLAGGVARGFLNLAVFWAVIGILILIAKKRPGCFDPVLRCLPIWRGILRHAALARLAGTLASLLRAGVGIGEAWALAADASGDRRLAEIGARIERGVEEERVPPGKFLGGLAVFPDDFRTRYLTGEKSGRLEEMLDRIREEHTQKVASLSGIAGAVYPTALLILVMFGVAVKIIGFFADYYDQLLNFK